MRFRARILGWVMLALGAVAALGAVVMVLWNAVVPVLFTSSHPIDYLHALGLLVLSRIPVWRISRTRWMARTSHAAKWQAMTP